MVGRLRVERVHEFTVDRKFHGAILEHHFRGRGASNLVVFLPMSTPEIVLGASLLALFLNWSGFQLGFRTIFIAHVMFIVSFVVPR